MTRSLRLLYLLVPLALGLASAAAPGGAQPASDPRFAFADTTLDHQFIHVDPEKAKHTPFGTTIAHGFLTLSMLSYFVGQIGTGMQGAVMGVNYGFDKVRLLSPVKVNSRVRARFRLASFQEKAPGQYLIKHEVTVEIERTRAARRWSPNGCRW